MRDYAGSMKAWKDRLKAVGSDFDVTDLCGCTEAEIEAYVRYIEATARDGKK